MSMSKVIAPGLLLPPRFRGARANTGADITTLDCSSGYIVVYDNEEYDTDGVHSNSSNNTRMTVPNLVSRVRMTAGMFITATTADEWWSSTIIRNGDSTDVVAGMTTETGLSQVSHCLISGILNATPGDYFEHRIVDQTDASVTLLFPDTFIEMEIIQ